MNASGQEVPAQLKLVRLAINSISGYTFKWEVERRFSGAYIAEATAREKSLSEYANKITRAKGKKEDIEKLDKWEAEGSHVVTEPRDIYEAKILAADSFLIRRTSYEKGTSLVSDHTWQAGGDGLCYQTLKQNRKINVNAVSALSPLHTLGGLPFAYLKSQLVKDVGYVLGQPPSDLSSVKPLADVAGAPSFVLQKSTNPAQKILVWNDPVTGNPLTIAELSDGVCTYKWTVGAPKWLEGRWPVECRQTFYESTGEEFQTESWKLLAAQPATLDPVPKLPDFPSGFSLEDQTTSPPTIIKVDMLKKLGEKVSSTAK